MYFFGGGKGGVFQEYVDDLTHLIGISLEGLDPEVC